MSTRARFTFALVVAVLFVLWTAPDASAAGGVTDIDYSGGYVNGYSATWKDWWDSDFSECVWWDYDYYYEQYYCAEEHYYYFWVSLSGALYMPSGNFWGGASTWDWSFAWIAYYATPNEYGTWTAIANHYLGRDAYYRNCYALYECDPVFYWYTSYYGLGQSGDTANVPPPPPTVNIQVESGKAYSICLPGLIT
jgi:hypothetical protein